MTRRPASPSGRSRLGRLLSLLAAPALTIPLLTGAASPGGAADDTRAVPSAAVVSALPGRDAGPDLITLITGDQVLLQPASEGRDSAVVEPAPRPSGQEPQFEVLDEGDDLYVIPDDAATLIPDRLDRELFNVTKLADYGYTDGVSVIVTDTPARAAATNDEGLSVTSRLPSVDGYAATVEPDSNWWSTIVPATGGFATATRASTQKVWLDELTEVSLDESVPMIGAPDAWASGYDGTGTTVAVLDTGVDPNHPDLAGQIAGTANFTDDSGITDQHGHGTHVASTIAGTGAGSNGQYTGVAPGAELLIGKICDASGTCPTSGTIDAMEWAAPQADVINMSIGSTSGNDGTSLSAMAINELSEQNPHTLFVVAAGNNGSQGEGSVASPGSADAALTVGAVDKQGNLAGFSSRGPRLGDFAIKPDITAPGVSITAARAAGTSMGTPVSDRYTTASGTSMATPHVAGSAAIVLQKYPDLGAAELKALLSTTATANPDLSVYEQGGGLVNIPAALTSPVVASPSPLNLGFFPYGEDHQPVEKTVTYTNPTDADVTVDLGLDVAHSGGTAVPTETLSVSPTTLTVPAGGAATATVTLRPDGVPIGTYGGYLVADSATGQTHIPVGFTFESEMYDVVVKGIARDGRPVTLGSLYVADAHNPASGYETLRFNNGVAEGRFTPGTYYVVGRLITRDGHDRYSQDKVFVGAPTLRLTEDTSLAFDAREASPVSVDAPEHPAASPAGQQAKTVIGYGGRTEEDNFAPQYIGPWTPTYVLESGAAEHGELEFLQQVRLAEPELALSVVSPEARDVYIEPLAGTPQIDESMDLDLVYAGEGAESDYDGVDANGKAVLVQRSELAYPAVEATARAHGAKALIMMNDTTGYFSGSVRPNAQIPSMAIRGEDGQRLRDQLATGDVTVRVSGSAWSPYLYDLALTRAGALPDGLHEVVHTDDLVTVNNSFYGEPGEPMGEYRALWRPYLTYSAQQVTPVKGAHQRTDYVAADTDSLYRQAVFGQYPLESGLQERDIVYPEVTEVTQDWFRGAMHPTVLNPQGPRNPGDPVIREGDTITMVLPEWSDSSDLFHYGYLDTTTDSTPLKVWVDDRYLGEVPRPSLRVQNLPQDDATVRFELTTTRDADWWQTSTKTLTNWTVHTSRPSSTALVPLLAIDYDTEVDLTNTAATPGDREGPATLDLHVRHQAGYEGGQVAGARVWVSYDDGATWERRPVMKRPGTGNYQAVLASPAAQDTPTGYVTVKVEAWDADNNRIDQELTRAWRLPAR